MNSNCLDCKDVHIDEGAYCDKYDEHLKTIGVFTDNPIVKPCPQCLAERRRCK